MSVLEKELPEYHDTMFLEGYKPYEILQAAHETMIKKHVEYLLKTKPEKVSMLEMRSHTSWYLKGVPNATKIRTQLNSITTKEELYNILDNFLGGKYES